MIFILFVVRLLRRTTNISEKPKKRKPQPHHHVCHRRIPSWRALLCSFSPSSMLRTRRRHHPPLPVDRWTKTVRGREGGRERERERERESGGGTCRGWSEKRRPVSRCRWRGGGRRIDAAVRPVLHAAGSAAGGAPQPPRPDPATMSARTAGSSHLAHLRGSTRPGGEDEVVEGEKVGSTPATTGSHPTSPDPAPTGREGGMGRAAVAGERGRGALGSSGLHHRVEELGRHRLPWPAMERRVTSSTCSGPTAPRLGCSAGAGG
jgi:hypothetical protein